MDDSRRDRSEPRGRAGWWIALLLLLLALSPPAAAHGGGYNPPAGPSSGVPTFTGPSSGSASGKGASTRGPLLHPGGPGAGPTTFGVGPAGKASGGTNATSMLGPAGPGDPWELWWHDNEERFLKLRSHLVQDRPASGIGPLSGIGRVVRGESRRAAASEVEREVVPLLLELLAHEHDPEILDSSLIALGRCADASDADAVMAAVRPHLASKLLSVQTSAVLALGIHGSPSFVPLLGAILQGTPDGCTALGGKDAPLLRALAALALGLGNHEASVPVLTDVLGTVRDAQVDIKACTITSLGLTDNPCGDDALACLRPLLRDRRLDAPLAAQVPLALVDLDGGSHAECVPDLLAAFTGKDTDDVVKVSIAMALGRLARPTDPAAFGALEAAAVGSHHEATRHAAIMALAEIGLRDTPDELLHAELHVRLAALLDKLFREPSRADRAWLALAAGVYARGGGSQAQMSVVPLLIEWQQMENDPSARGAFDIALGLARVTETADVVRRDVVSPGDPLLRGQAAEALGMLGSHDAEQEMLATCSDRTTEPLVREQTAVGLALLKNPQVVPTLLDVLGRQQLHEVSYSVARSLGRIGDKSAIPDLLTLARDASRQPGTRGMAVVALGLLGERGDLPWNAALRELHNPETPIDSLQLVFDIL